jgi:outer membrane protein assembly factor BamB
MAAVRTAVVAAVFSLVVAALMLYDFGRRQWKDPLEATAVAALKAALATHPGDNELKKQIRILDQWSREEYFRQRRFADTGAVLLLGSLTVLLIAAKAAATLRRKLPNPPPPTAAVDREAAWTRVARRAVAGLAAGLIAVTIALSVNIRSDVPIEDEEPAAQIAAGGAVATATPLAPSRPEPQELLPAPTAGHRSHPSPLAGEGPGVRGDRYAPSAEEISNAWPRFRGPAGSGISPYTNVPETWDGATGKNILWKTAVPLPGHNSPVVCGKRVFLSGADASHRQVYCFDAVDGKLLWQQDVPGTPESTAKPPEVDAATGFAAPTAATDGRRICAIFANGDLAAFDYAGNLVWKRSLGVPESAYGHAASLAVFKNLLLVPFDQGAKASDAKSKLLALDFATGKPVWEQRRPVPNSWATPIVIHGGDRDQVIASGDPWVIAYDAATGAELWRVKCLRNDVAPSPAFAHGMVFVAANESEALSAIRVDGHGDVTETHVAWKGEDNVPDACSLLATEDYVFPLTSSGKLTCYNAASGDNLWEEDLRTKFKSSPSLVGKRLYLIDEDGKLLVVEPGHDGCKRIGAGNLGEKCCTSPAFQDGRIYLRGQKHLFCIGSK